MENSIKEFNVNRFGDVVQKELGHRPTYRVLLETIEGFAATKMTKDEIEFNFGLATDVAIEVYKG